MKKFIFILLAFALTADASIRFGKSDGTLTNKVKHIQIGSHPVKKVEIYREDNSGKDYVLEDYGRGSYGILPDDATWEITFYTSSYSISSVRNKWEIDYSGSKTPSHIVVNGREFSLTAPVSDVSTTVNEVPADFRASASKLSWNLNIKFTDGSYFRSSSSMIKVWEKAAGPTITSFSVAPQTIDLDTRATGTIAFNFGVTATPSTPTATPSMISFVAQTTNGGGNWFQNAIADLRIYRLIGTRSLANANLIIYYNFTIIFIQVIQGFKKRLYLHVFLNSFIKTKFPVNLLIGANSYPVSYRGGVTSGGKRLESNFITTNPVTNTADQVSNGRSVALTSIW